MTRQISAQEMEQYKQTARARWRARAARAKARRAHAWTVAREAAELLKTEFGVERVAVFGSAIHPGRFTLWSDLDLAAWGLTANNWLRAMGAVRQMSEEIEVNLVDVAACSPQLRQAIEEEGVIL